MPEELEKISNFYLENSKSIDEIYNEYLKLRPEGVPFPWESVVNYLFMALIAERASQKGNLLELGVEHGGSAFLTLLTLRPDEQFFLVDQRKTDKFELSFEKLSSAQQQQVVFVISKTIGEQTKPLLESKYRWIHIDAGHQQPEVMQDLQRFEPVLRNDGILIMDDFFQGRWPGVTEATYNYFDKYSPDLKPLVIAYNKIYFCRSNFYNQIFNDIRELGTSYFSWWGNIQLIETSWREIPCFFLRGSVEPSKRGYPINI